MSKDLIQTNQAQEIWNVSGTYILKYTVEMYHTGLKEHKLISAPEMDMLENKVNLQAQKWVEKWESIELKRRINADKEANLEEAKSRTEAANKSLKQIDSLLIHTLTVDDRVDWESLKKKESYSEKLPSKPTQKRKKEYPPKPDKKTSEFTPAFTFFEKLFNKKKERKIQEFENKYSTAILEWENQKTTIDTFNKQLVKDFEVEMKKWERTVIEWEKRKNDFLQKQVNFNAKIDKMKESYLSQNNDSIIEYCEMVLNNSEYPMLSQKILNLSIILTLKY
jgi:restriction system protein